MKLSIIIPCYNEEKNIPLVLEKFNSVIKRKDIEVILVNNGSKDNSQLVLETLIPKHPFARTVKVEINQGYGFGILSGLKEAKGDYIGWTHADMQTDPNDSIKALELIESRGNPEKIFVKGNRKGRALLDNFFTIGMSVFESVYMGRILWDINAQPNIFHKSLFALWVNPPQDFSLDLFALYSAKRNGYEVLRFTVIFPPRLHGISSWNTGLKAKWKFIKRTLDFSFKLKKEL